MANYFNFYSNWQKAKDYDKIVKENVLLVKRVESWREGLCQERKLMKEQLEDKFLQTKNELSVIYVRIDNVINWAVNSYVNNEVKKPEYPGLLIQRLISAFELHKNSINNYKVNCSKQSDEINNLKLQLQKRDTKTGRFVKK